MSARMCSVPLCLGMVRSISSRASSFSSSVEAQRNHSSAFLYSGVRLAGIFYYYKLLINYSTSKQYKVTLIGRIVKLCGDSVKSSLQIVTEGLMLASYRFDKYMLDKTREEKGEIRDLSIELLMIKKQNPKVQMELHNLLTYA